MPPKPAPISSAARPNAAKLERDAAMRELAAGFERKIGGIVEAVAVAASEMQGMSSSMSSSNAETARQDRRGRRGFHPGLHNVGRSPPRPKN